MHDCMPLTIPKPPSFLIGNEPSKNGKAINAKTTKGTASRSEEEQACRRFDGSLFGGVLCGRSLFQREKFAKRIDGFVHQFVRFGGYRGNYAPSKEQVDVTKVRANFSMDGAPVSVPTWCASQTREVRLSSVNKMRRGD